jgi:putative sigma-54 modulation protein
MYAAIDLMVDKLDRQVIKHKDKIQGHAHESVKYRGEPQELEAPSP